MKYKLLAIDMDGTTLNSRNEISSENLESILRLKDSGVKIIIITGRMYNAVTKYYKMLELDTPVVCYNGARIFDNSGNCIYDKGLNREDLECSLKIDDLEENEATPLYFIDEDLVVLKHDKNVLEYEKRTGIKAVLNPELYHEDFNTTKVIFSSYNFDYLIGLRKRLEKMFMDRVYITNSMPRYIEILNKEVSKGAALKYIANMYDISLEDCVVVGDNNNDIKMFLPEVYKVAVKNGEEALKNKADYITETNNNHGVSKAIEKIFFN